MMFRYKKYHFGVLIETRPPFKEPIIEYHRHDWEQLTIHSLRIKTVVFHLTKDKWYVEDLPKDLALIEMRIEHDNNERLHNAVTKLFERHPNEDFWERDK